MKNLDTWLNELLNDLHVPRVLSGLLDELILVIFLILVAVILHYICKVFILKALRKFTKRTRFRWDDLLVQHNVIGNLVQIIPAVLIYIFLPFVFSEGRRISDLIQKVCVLYIVFSIILALNGLVLALYDHYQLRHENNTRSIKGFIQVLQILVFFIGAIIMIGIIINKSPAALLAGLGASAAILSFIFKDSLTGLLAGVQLSMNDMVRPGDWITLSDKNIDGIVQEITLITVKVKNFDQSISTIPPTLLLTNTFKNWRELNESGEHLVSKSIVIDKSTVKFCSPELIQKIKDRIPLMADYQIPSATIAPTNIQLFRTYMEKYVESLPAIDKETEIKINQQDPTDKGIPVQIFFFSHSREDNNHEHIQAGIFDHAIASASLFELKIT